MNDKIDVTDLLKNVLSSTMDAEYKGYQRYLDILQDLEGLGNISFSYLDDSGEPMSLEIPIVTLVPLTMLHIEEAVFDFSLNLSSKEESSVTAPSLSDDAKAALSGSGMMVSASSKEENDETTNLVIKVEMGLADLSSGLIAMLQKKNNSKID